MLLFTALLALVATVSARQCKNLTIPVGISARNAVFDMEPPSDLIGATDFFLKNSWAGGNYTDELLSGYDTVSGDYNLRATYCRPDSGPGDTLQILSHGVGFDRGYWDQWWNDGNYSYVARAVDEFGYSTLTWDRLGIGESSSGDPLNEIQIFLDIAALHELTNRVASGSVCGINTTYHRILHAGHSFGAIITYNLANLWPNSTQGIALTGFSQVPNFMAEFVMGANFVPVAELPALAHKYGPGWYAPQSRVGVLNNFFAPGQFAPEILDLAYQTGQPFSAGEVLTVAAGAGIPNVYTGPVLVVTGDRDIPFCGGNCSSTAPLTAMGLDGKFSNLIELSSMFFQQASDFNATIIPDTGHGLNYQYSHPTTFETMLDFFQSHS